MGARMKVTPISKTLADVLRGNFLRIPRFQRPYDWDRDNLTEFWMDLKDRSEPEYFMGSLVVFGDQKEKNLLSLVDGQQRITTVTIMLSIIRDALEKYGENGPAAAIHDLIETRDLDNKSRFVLEHDPADRFMQQAIQARSVDRKVKPEGTQQENLSAAYRYLSSVLDNHLAQELADRKPKIVEYLKHLRDCLLQMHFISIELDNEDDAYLIFETLNTRGKDLRASDLLKNHFMRLLPARTKGFDTAKNLWAETMEKLNSVTVSIDPDSFLLHYWLSTQFSVSKANLFIEYKKHVKKVNARRSLEDIHESASTYVRCMAPMEAKFSKEEKPLQASMNAIRIFGVAQAAPLMLAIMNRYEGNIISLKSTKNAFLLIEKFTFQFNALTQSRGGGGVSNMYAKLAQRTMQSDTAQAFASVVLEMREKFVERVPDEDQFAVPFSRIMFRSNYTRERNLVRYVLSKIARHYGMPDELDVSLMTIEHILPQSKGDESGDHKDVGAIGNLTFIVEKLNGKLDDKSFKEKKRFYTTANSVYLDEVLQGANDWDADMIAKRGMHLAKVGYEKIWKI